MNVILYIFIHLAYICVNRIKGKIKGLTPFFLMFEVFKAHSFLFSLGSYLVRKSQCSLLCCRWEVQDTCKELIPTLTLTIIKLQAYLLFQAILHQLEEALLFSSLHKYKPFHNFLVCVCVCGIIIFWHPNQILRGSPCRLCTLSKTTDTVKDDLDDDHHCLGSLFSCFSLITCSVPTSKHALYAVLLSVGKFSLQAVLFCATFAEFYWASVTDLTELNQKLQLFKDRSHVSQAGPYVSIVTLLKAGGSLGPHQMLLLLLFYAPVRKKKKTFLVLRVVGKNTHGTLVVQCRS